MDGDNGHAESKTGEFNWSLRSPFHGIEGTEDEAGDLVARIYNLVVPELYWITKLVRGQLELALEDYAVYISGTPVRITRLGSETLGYSIHISVHPNFANVSGPEATELVGRAGMGD
jgi:hypothetical protein